MIPLGDEHTTLRTPVMTYAIITVNVLSWLLIHGAGFNEPALAASVFYPQVRVRSPEVSSGVAFWAHVGGFVAGLVLVKLFENRALVAQRAVAA